MNSGNKNQRIFKVKLTFPYDWPIFRQTPGGLGKWGNYQFYLNNEIEECDFWVIFSKYQLKKVRAICPPENVIFMPCEAFSIAKFSKHFLKQFALIITCQREIQHHNISFDLAAHPWFVEKNYDELLAMEAFPKTKKISLITSNKVMTEGHRKRLDFAYKLKDHFKENIDLYGRGIKDFEDKWDVLAPYKYSIAIENDNTDDWLTEKFYDCHLAYTYPIYYGCPNAEKYFDSRSFARIDINDFDKSVKIIEDILSDEGHYEQHLDSIQEARLLKLNKYNLFPLLVSYFENLNPNSDKKSVTIKPEALSSIKSTIKNIFKFNYTK